jgi:hypothetical protein
MNKVVLALVVAVSLVGGSTASYAAAKPSIAKPSKAGVEGTAKHEMSESTATQKSEAKTTGKSKTVTKAKKK